jgi:hypothetical protein
VASGEGENPVGRVEELGRLEDHLDNVLVAVPSCTARWLMRQIEDIHSLEGGRGVGYEGLKLAGGPILIMYFDKNPWLSYISAQLLPHLLSVCI